MRGLQTIGRDLQRIAKGSQTLWHYLRTPECVDLGLGMFVAASRGVVVGQLQGYRLRIANACEAKREVTLSFDIYSVELPRHPEGHYAYFTKRVATDPHTVCLVDIEYDWLTTARFMIDTVVSPPDASWRGEIQPPRLCAVHAIVYGDDSREIDRLTIYQEVPR